MGICIFMLEGRDKKKEFWEKLWRVVEEYLMVFVCDVDNVKSVQLQEVRKALRGRCVVMFRKNTLVRAGLKVMLKRVCGKENSMLQKINELLPLIKGNVCLIFSQTEFQCVFDAIEESKIPKEAKTGEVSPCNIYIPSGITNLDPTRTAFFSVYNIATKITKGKIQVINDVKLIEKGQKIAHGQASLLKSFDIKPFFYELKIIKICYEGHTFNPELFTSTKNTLLQKFVTGTKNIVAISLECGIPTTSSAIISMINGYARLKIIGSMIDYNFDKPKNATHQMLTENQIEIEDIFKL